MDSASSTAPTAAATADSLETAPQDRVFESAAELFAMLATPVRLKIISAVCQQEKNVSELLAMIDTTQPNMSQHLATLYRSGVLAKRREGTQIYYRLQSERVAVLCRAVCTQVAIELESGPEIEPADRLVPLTHR
jgi:DNA-binding transcriptional ArsR family regulator